MELLDVMQARRSVRNYTGEEIPREKLQMILQVGLLSASAKAKRPWEMIVVTKREMLDALSGFRGMPSGMLSRAGAAIAVIADETLSDVWIEDCTIVMANMHLMADSLGVGSCWIQGRNRFSPDGGTSEEFVRNLLGFPEKFRLEAVLSLGMTQNHPPRHELDELRTDKIHWETY